MKINKDIKETEMIEQLPIVFILGGGRCGGLLLHTVLDWHDEIIMLPVKFKFYGLWQQKKCDEITDPQKIADIFLTIIGRNTGSTYAGVQEDFSLINWDIFETKFLQYLKSHEVCSHNTLVGIMYAYTCASKKNFETAKVIIIRGLYKNFMKDILRDFPEARFIHLIRDHRANISSFQAFFLSMYGTLVHPTMKLPEKSLFIHIIKDKMVANRRMYQENQQLMESNRLKILRFEDIKISPRETIEKLSNWLGINFDESLMQLTLAGKPYSGGHTGFPGQQVVGFDTTPVYRWKKRMARHEIRMVEFLFGKDLKFYGYDLIYGGKNLLSNIVNFICCFLPWQGEIFHAKLKRMPYYKKKKAKGFFRYNVLLIKILCRNIAMFIISRIIFSMLFFKGEFKINYK